MVTNSGIRVGTSGAIGRGVFAVRAFSPGELIETAPVLVISPEDWARMEKTVLFSYTYAFSSNGGDEMALALGFGSMYNHSYSPNARYVKHIEDQAIDYIALRPILPGEEITINYNGDPDCRDPLWFPVEGAASP